MPLTPAQFAAIVKTYQINIDDLILLMGKDVELHFEQTITQESGFYDQIHGGLKQPKYKGTMTNPAPIIQDNIQIIRCLTKFDPIEFSSFGNIKVQEAKAIVRLKGYLSDVPALTRCTYMIPALDSNLYINMKFRLIRNAVPKGLRDDRYAVTYWMAT